MNFLKLPKQISDGRVLTYHRVEKIEFPQEAGQLVVYVGSFENKEQAQLQGRPDMTSAYALAYEGDVNLVLPQLYDRLLLLPEWQGGVIDAYVAPMPEIPTPSETVFVVEAM